MKNARAFLYIPTRAQVVGKEVTGSGVHTRLALVFSVKLTICKRTKITIRPAPSIQTFAKKPFGVGSSLSVTRH